MSFKLRGASLPKLPITKWGRRANASKVLAPRTDAPYVTGLLVLVLLPLYSLTALFWGAEPVVAQEAKLPFKIPRSASELPRGAIIETTKGPIEITFFRDAAPITVRNFQYLAGKNFYHNLTFHRHLPDYVIQGGDPQGNGKGGPPYRIPPEFSDLKHIAGTVGMARLDDRVNPERLSNGSQFYIMLAPARHLDGLYTVFAEVKSGLDVARSLVQGDRIIRVTIVP